MERIRSNQMKLRIVEKGDGRFYVEKHDSESDWVVENSMGVNAVFRTYDEAVLYIENLKNATENADKANTIKQIYEEFEV
jgi:hypothetical protein